VGYYGSFGDILFVKEPDAQNVITQFLGGPSQQPTTPPIAPSGYAVTIPHATSGGVPSGTSSTTSGTAPGGVSTTTATTAPPPAAYNPTPC
jgi:hypothetical protein